MKVLAIGRCRSGHLSPFVMEQVSAIRNLGVAIDTMTVQAGGVRGYTRFARQVGHAVRSGKYDIVHAHYGLTGLVATLQRDAPTVITFHGSDVNQRHVRPLSRIAARRAAASIAVSEELAKLGAFPAPPFIIPCGVDPNLFFPEDHQEARRACGFGDEPVVLFGSSRTRKVKNFPLAAAAVAQVGMHVRLLELQGLPREGVRTLLSAVDALVLTSHSEGSPQIVKEALLTGCPVVSTDVGDVKQVLKDVPHCHVAERSPYSIAAALNEILRHRHRVPRLERFDTLTICASARKVIDVYERVMESVNGRSAPAGLTLNDAASSAQPSLRP